MKTYTHQIKFGVDAGNFSLVDTKEFGGEARIVVPPGRYKARVQMECWLGEIDEEKEFETESGRLYAGDCCYLHDKRYDEMIDAMCGGKKLPGFVSFSTGGDGHFLADVGLTYLGPIGETRVNRIDHSEPKEDCRANC